MFTPYLFFNTTRTPTPDKIYLIKDFQSITIYLHLLLIAFPNHVDMTKSLPKGSQSKLKMVHENGFNDRKIQCLNRDKD